MSHQSELALEKILIEQLKSLEYEPVTINDENDLIVNLKKQLEIHNNVTLSDKEFSVVLNHLSKGNVFEKARILRDKFALTRDDGSTKYIQFINQHHRCQNEYQVTNQVTMEGSYKNRYDVTILINGLPLVQIELKRRGLELKEAFNQTNRYQRHSYDAHAGLFQYVQLFVISNGVNTKYYANNRHQSFKQTFFRADKENKTITQLDAFTKEFLEPCHLSKMITKYIVLNETHKILMVLRPYQYYATEAIIERVKHSDRNGYIRHTTGSGKTLTSFKTAQILVDIPEVYKVVFVVDRKDLDYQTTKEFNSFSKGSIDGTEDTKTLVKQLSNDTKLIVTTIQKLNTAITKQHYLDKVETIQHERIVLIFDECHRSQFGDTHKRIKSFFTKAQMFGFTGTPIFADNHNQKQTTADLFEEPLHKYVITDAISDENVLRFSIEYVGKYKEKQGSNNDVDITVEDIDTKELMDSPERLTKIVDYIIANHNRKTHQKEFTAMMCVSSVDTLIKYYDIFASKKLTGEHNLRIATIFSYTANEADADANGIIPEEIDANAPVNMHSRDILEKYITDYNDVYHTNFTTKDSQSFYNYYNDIAKRVKNKEVDILLVVNMFLTGFDSPALNTLYVDKNLKYHGLIQAFSRTNRLLNEKKSQGNIVCFRNLKQATDEAITLFSNKDAIQKVLMEPYEVYKAKCDEAIEKLLELVPSVDSVNDLVDEEEKLSFVQAFREIMRLQNILSGFADYKFDSFAITAQEYEDYKSKYLDMYDSVKSRGEKEKVSILQDVDFELELIARDEITVSYILHLLAKLKGTGSEAKKDLLHKQIMQIVGGNIKLRSKKALIEEFISSYMSSISDSDHVESRFYDFLNEEKQKALDLIIQEELLIDSQVQKILERYIFAEKKPLRDDIVASLQNQPTILERAGIIQRVSEKLMKFIETFIDNV